MLPGGEIYSVVMDTVLLTQGIFGVSSTQPAMTLKLDLSVKRCVSLCINGFL